MQPLLSAPSRQAGRYSRRPCLSSWRWGTVNPRIVGGLGHLVVCFAHDDGTIASLGIPYRLAACGKSR